MSGSRLAVFVIRRAATLAIMLAAVSIIVFLLLYAAPGNLVEVLLGGRPSTPETIATIRHLYHLDDPLPVQYLLWLNGAIHGNLGTSVRTGQPVSQAILERFQLTLFLAAYGFIVATIGGVALGFAAALRRESLLDRIVTSAIAMGASSPSFATGILLLYIFGVVLGWFPVFGPGQGFIDELWHLTLPALALALTGVALVTKITRAAMVNALDQDYVGFARARGVAYRRVVTAYALRNSLGPIVTAGGLIFNRMLFETVLVEVIFALPGVGALLVTSVEYHDVPMVQAWSLLLAGIVVLVNLLIDIAYVAIDPRVRFERGAL